MSGSPLSVASVPSPIMALDYGNSCRVPSHVGLAKSFYDLDYLACDQPQIPSTYNDDHPQARHNLQNHARCWCQPRWHSSAISEQFQIVFTHNDYLNAYQRMPASLHTATPDTYQKPFTMSLQMVAWSATSLVSFETICRYHWSPDIVFKISPDRGARRSI